MNAEAAITPSRLTPCSMPQAVEQVDEVLGREVADRARTGERAAAEAARRAVDDRHAPLERRVDVGQRLAARVVGVQPDAPDVDQREHGVEHARDVAGRRRPDRVAEADLVAAEVEQPAAPRRPSSPGPTSPSYGQPNATDT